MLRCSVISKSCRCNFSKPPSFVKNTNKKRLKLTSWLARSNKCNLQRVKGSPRGRRWWLEWQPISKLSSNSKWQATRWGITTKCGSCYCQHKPCKMTIHPWKLQQNKEGMKARFWMRATPLEWRIKAEPLTNRQRQCAVIKQPVPASTLKPSILRRNWYRS